MQTWQNVEKMAKCGDFFSDARDKAKLMINFFGLEFDHECLHHHLISTIQDHYPQWFN